MLDKPPKSGTDPALLARFAAIVGEKYAITDPQAQLPYLVEMRDLYRGRSPMVLRPGSVTEVAEILKLANATGTPIVPQGGNTGLVGGQTPHNNEIVLSLTRLDRIREVDPISNTMTCEAGVTLQHAREAAAAADRLYPQLLPSEGTCTIGGNLSSNAGGVAALAYGIARSHALGVEVVLADGRVLNNLNKLKKDNTGYDLKNLFIGAEGTLGVITAAVLRLVPRPRAVETAFVGVRSPEAALALLTLATDRAGAGVTSYELMSRAGLVFVLQHDAGSRDPLAAPHPWYVLIELSSQAESGLREVMEDVLAQGLQRDLIADATIADSLEQAKAFWRIREMFGEVQRHVGGSIKHDVSVPVAAVPAFLQGGRRCRDGAHSRRASAAIRPSRRRQYPLQRDAAGGGRQGSFPQAVGRSECSGFCGREEIRRIDLGRTRHWCDETRSAADGKRPGRPRTDARPQAHARSQRHPQSRQGSVAPKKQKRPRPGSTVEGRLPYAEAG